MSGATGDGRGGSHVPRATTARAAGPQPSDGALTRLWEAAARIQATVRARGWWDDRASAAATALLGLALIGLGLASPAPPWVPAAVADRVGAWHVVLLLVACTALVVKRRHPVGVLLVAVTCTVLDAVLGGSVATSIALFDALYTAALLTRPVVRRRIVATVVVVVVVAPVLVLVAGAPPREAVLLLLQSVALYVTPLWWAKDVRQRDELAALEAGRARAEAERAEAERSRAEAERSRAEAERRRADLEQRAAALARAHADDLERIAELDRTSAVREERARTARDLHDVVAGHVSAVAIRAEAALAGPPDADADRAALRAVRAGTLDALTELRSMIMVLRERPGAATAPSGLARLDAFVALAQAAGQDVVVDGPVPTDLPVAVDLAAFRIVQEALTNAAKHAPGAPAVVTLRRSDGSLELTVTNPADGSSAAHPPAVATGLRGGTGLHTMRERAEALGGRLDAGLVDGAWRVRARLPEEVA
ncbi:sensor histidine kinase [Cellulomonas fimi]|uniref:histidine kinase n=1 Tax=Cellulomonas fimi (strain ATCC 484 / DSM 20113 / JCM 1341 / CCUG 24087 / LMG 16345 / NBRC 15513 / NCIMB 8980 / NCTC 7547 / NRS-133) TaxID=590998 RepID=F4H4J0_CELFA|nr:histidine kinase [Cellulomonas fimi]AEE47785.1 integral membrane sensor signal transduction histidine kinase [Cellulomonas fimi ATCC 484]NNH06679.1 two-component sensor histidine kinase [Cellulomonas fimi]VEH36996.1 Nitrate/nitrite sensor protein narX [Cellulomonas fimi]